MAETDLISGVMEVTQVLFPKPGRHEPTKNGYCIVKAINPEKKEKGEFVYKGVLQNVNKGIRYKVSGYMQSDPRNPGERFFNIRTSEVSAQQSKESWIEYLQREGPNVGDVKATQLVQMFGDKVIEVLANEPEKAAGLQTPERLKELSAWAKSELALSSIKRKLYSLGMTPWIIRTILIKYGKETVKILEQDPYQIMKIRGVGFATATKVAVAFGAPLEHPTRIRYGILEVMKVHARNGHSCMNYDTMIEKAVRLLGVGRDSIIEAARLLLKDGEVCSQRSDPKKFSKRSTIIDDDDEE